MLYVRVVGMEPLAKTQLIQSLVKLLEDAGIISAEICRGEVRSGYLAAEISVSLQ